MKLQNGDMAVVRLSERAFEILESPIRSRVSRGRNQQGMIDARFISKAAPPFVRVLWCAAATRQPDAEFPENRKGARHNGVARISETDRPGNAVFDAAVVDRFDLLAQLAEGSRRHRK